MQEELRRETTGSVENREKPLAGKVALITGASRDVGAGIAIALAKEGASIVGNYREKSKRAGETQTALNSIGVKSEFVQADITNPQERKKLSDVLDNLGGKLDILVLNASGPSRDINVDAANSLLDIFLPKMPKGGKIILMQSVPGHYEPQLDGLGKIPEFYIPIAKAKYEGEQSLRARIPEFSQKVISFFVICPPEVTGTFNMMLFQRHDPQVSEKHAKMSAMLGLPNTVTIQEVGRKTTELLKIEGLPMGYVELFGEAQDTRSVLSEWYGNEAIFVDTLKIENNEQSGTGRLIVTKEHTKGHFNKGIDFSVFPGHLMIEAAAQTLGLIAMGNRIPSDVMPLFQGIETVQFLKSATIGDALQIRASILETSKRGFTGNAKIVNQNNQEIASINGIKFVILKTEAAKRLLGIK